VVLVLILMPRNRYHALRWVTQLSNHDNVDLTTTFTNGTNAAGCMVSGVASAFVSALPRPPARKQLLFTALIGHPGTDVDVPVNIELELPDIAVTFAREARVERVPGCTNMQAPCSAMAPILEPAIQIGSGERTIVVRLAPGEAIRVKLSASNSGGQSSH
jgi:hypothetical protein